LSKVNRCITEGGRALRKRAAAIEDGQDCERLAPLLGRHADGVIGLDDLPALQRHLRTCLACRARLNALGSAQRRASKCAIEPDGL
jgi:predicted anti-sigma-YlaC factor YlaD